MVNPFLIRFFAKHAFDPSVSFHHHIVGVFAVLSMGLAWAFPYLIRKKCELLELEDNIISNFFDYIFVKSKYILDDDLYLCMSDASLAFSTILVMLILTIWLIWWRKLKNGAPTKNIYLILISIPVFYFVIYHVFSLVIYDDYLYSEYLANEISGTKLISYRSLVWYVAIYTIVVSPIYLFFTISKSIGTQREK